MSFVKAQIYVIQWAENKGITKATAEVQALKLMSELGELSDCIIKQDKKGIYEELGDVIVTLVILSEILKIDFTECFYKSYEKIKNRTGRRLDNGVFIKDE
jgi:NTP pyrophosphatase (non-canonical NTP hydrolase)